MQGIKTVVLSLIAVLFLAACASTGSYEDDQSRGRERSSTHRH